MQSANHNLLPSKLRHLFQSSQIRNRASQLLRKAVIETLENRTLLSFTVTTTADPGGGYYAGSNGFGSLRWDIQQADAVGGNQTITFDGPMTIDLDGNTLELNDTTGTMEISGLGGLTINGEQSGNPQSAGVFQIDPSTTVQMDDMTITGGDTANGGGINNEGTLTVTDCTVTRNTAMFGGGILNIGDLTIAGSEVSNNSHR